MANPSTMTITVKTSKATSVSAEKIIKKAQEKGYHVDMNPLKKPIVGVLYQGKNQFFFPVWEITLIDEIIYLCGDEFIEHTSGEFIQTGDERKFFHDDKMYVVFETSDQCILTEKPKEITL